MHTHASLHTPWAYSSQSPDGQTTDGGDSHPPARLRREEMLTSSHQDVAHGPANDHAGTAVQSLWGTAVQATLHCLTGCAIGEVLGMILATAFGWGNAASIFVAVVLAFFFGYALTLRPVIAAGVPLRRALGLAFASDTVSIATMEVVDNTFILIVPGATAAGLTDGLFWWSLALSLVIAFVLTVPVNRVLIARGRGHAVLHEMHAH
jgi:hypothetical protein